MDELGVTRLQGLDPSVPLLAAAGAGAAPSSAPLLLPVFEDRPSAGAGGVDVLASSAVPAYADIPASAAAAEPPRPPQAAERPPSSSAAVPAHPSAPALGEAHGAWHAAAVRRDGAGPALQSRPDSEGLLRGGGQRAAAPQAASGPAGRGAPPAPRMSALHGEVLAFAEAAAPTAQEAALVREALWHVGAAAGELWPGSRTVLFGSQATGLALPVRPRLPCLEEPGTVRVGRPP
jgi:hypothetical protein